MTAPEPAFPPGWRLICYDAIGSTNDAAKRLAAQGAAEGTVVWAREQNAGRGRRGRAWVSPRGNLYTSMILYPECPASRAAQLGFVAALALGDGLAPLLPPAAVLAYKWPNDVLLNGGKIAGILLESETGEGGSVAFVVVGVGVNLVSSPREAAFPATSLAEHGIGQVSPEIVLEGFAHHFRSWLQRWREQGFAPVRAAWLRRATSLGAPIRVRLDGATLRGRFLDIDDEGTLLLEEAGRHRRISAGEVFPANR